MRSTPGRALLHRHDDAIVFRSTFRQREMNCVNTVDTDSGHVSQMLKLRARACDILEQECSDPCRARSLYTI